jgi:hypothetical protein
LSFYEVNFHPSLRHFLGVVHDLFRDRDVFARRFFDTAHEYLSAGISWLTSFVSGFGDRSTGSEDNPAASLLGARVESRRSFPIRTTRPCWRAIRFRPSVVRLRAVST